MSALLCPSESANLQLYSVELSGRHRTYYSPSAITSAITVDRRLQPYSGTIVPGYNVEAVDDERVGAATAVVGMQSITDGTSNTGLFSERLLSHYPYRHHRDGLSAGDQRVSRGLHGNVCGAAELGDTSPT